MRLEAASTLELTGKPPGKQSMSQGVEGRLLALHVFGANGAIFIPAWGSALGATYTNRFILMKRGWKPRLLAFNSH